MSTPSPAGPLARVIVWEDRTAWPMFAASVLFFALSTWFLIDENLSTLHQTVISLVIVILWIWFIIDYLIRLAKAKGVRRRFVRTRAFDLMSLVVPLLRPFLIVVFIWRLPVFRYGNSARQRLRYLVVMALFAFMFVYTASCAVWLVERDAHGANLLNFGDALWWGFSTITTVGYGDFTPVTVWGRILGVGLMIGGIVVIGVTSATIVSDLNERIRGIAHLKHRDSADHSDVDH